MWDLVLLYTHVGRFTLSWMSLWWGEWCWRPTWQKSCSGWKNRINWRRRRLDFPWWKFASDCVLQAGFTAAPTRAISSIKNMNIPQQIKDIKLPDLPQAIKDLKMWSSPVKLSSTGYCTAARATMHFNYHQCGFWFIFQPVLNSLFIQFYCMFPLLF